MHNSHKICPVCNESYWEPLFHQEPWTVYKCKTCGLGILDPQPSEEEMAALYQESYFTGHYDEGLRPGTTAMDKRIAEERHRIKFFQPFIKQGKILDIGCGRGYFLLACKKQGYDVQGYDISKDGAAYIQNTLRIPVATGPLKDAFTAGSFDVVTMWHSLEHTPDPASYLEQARRWLRPDGVLVVDVPNYAGTDARLKWEAWEDWDLPYHLFHYTPTSLEMLLKRSGFVVISKKNYHSSVIKNRVRKIPLLGLFARLIAKLFSGSSFAVVAKKLS